MSLIFNKDVWKSLIRERCVAKGQYNYPMDKHAICLVSSPKKRGTCIFLHAVEIIVEVIGRRIIYVLS